MLKPLFGIAFVSVSVVVSATPSFECSRIYRPSRETQGLTNLSPVQDIDGADWIWADAPDAERTPLVVRFRREFVSDGSAFDLDVSADERYALTIDGQIVSRGPHRGLVDRWNYQSYRVRPTAGTHVVEATVARLGAFRPGSQATWRGGFILKASGDSDSQLTTGKAAWRAAILRGTVCVRSDESRTGGLVGWPFEVTGASWIDETPAASAFGPVKVVRPHVVTQKWGDRRQGWMLFPSFCPDQLEASVRPGAFLTGDEGLRARLNALLKDGTPVCLPPGTDETFLWDLGNYYCAYPDLVVSGGNGSVLDWHWAEALYDERGVKGRRDDCKGLAFGRAMGDRFRSDGRARAAFSVPWWRCGRWCRLRVKVGATPLTMTRLALVETRYPLDDAGCFTCTGADLAPIARICRRALENCTHETLMDCPYYEQAMYPGDGRVELQMLSVLTSDRRIAQTALALFDASRRNDGFVPMVTPSWSGCKDSATYTMCWIMMFGDQAMRGTDAKWLKAHLPGMRAALEGLARYEDGRGLVRDLPGWCYVDASAWPSGAPSGGHLGERPGCVINLQYLQALQAAVLAERTAGETDYAALHDAKAVRLLQAIRSAFFDSGRGLLAEDEERRSFTAHAQCLGILTDALPREAQSRAVESLADFKRSGYPEMGAYFRYYLFEAFFKCGRADLFLKGLDGWKAQVAAGLSTTTESGELNCRSDCHAWSASPLYFIHAGLVGVGPSRPLFGAVRIAPQPGSLASLRAQTPTPRGLVGTDFDFSGGGVRGEITLPEGLPGEFVWRGRRIPLHAGINRIDMAFAAFAIDNDHANLVYRTDEDAVFTVTVWQTNGVKAASGRVKATLDNFGPKVISSASYDLARGNPFVVRGRLGEPGFLRLRLDGGARGSRVWSVACDPQLIRPGSMRPDDFFDYWRRERARLAREVGPDVRCDLLAERSKDCWNVYSLSFATFGGKRVYGFMSVPKDASKGPFPVYFSVPGAGPGWSDCGRRENAICVMMNVLDYEPFGDLKKRGAEYGRKISEKWNVKGGYPVSGIAKGTSREDYFFHDVILGIDRALDWIASRPEADRRRIRYEGQSQGGGFGLILAGLDSDRISRVVAYVPAITDLLGSRAGRQSGWPYLAESQLAPEAKAVAETVAPYFDAAHFASSITCPVRILVGFSDTTCPPPAVYSAFNAIPSADKKIVHGIGMTHDVDAGLWQELHDWLCAKDAEK